MTWGGIPQRPQPFPDAGAAKGLYPVSHRAAFSRVSGGETAYIPGTVNTLDASTPDIQREFFDFYRTERGGYTPQGQKEELTTKPMLSSIGKFMNFYPFNDIETISPRPMLFITGDQAHSKSSARTLSNAPVSLKNCMSYRAQGMSICMTVPTSSLLTS
jgi:fermentation-respiration switch protein FrsA (DUF1100 family)